MRPQLARLAILPALLCLGPLSAHATTARGPDAVDALAAAEVRSDPEPGATLTAERELSRRADARTRARETLDLVTRLDDEPPGLPPGLGEVVLTPPAAEVDPEDVAAQIEGALAGNVVGLAYAVTRDGQLRAADGLGWARKPADGGVAMSEHQRFNVASVSKTVTAVATLKLLEANGLTPDDPIHPWLPDEWVQGLGVWGPVPLTFRHLLTHTSGFTQLGNVGNTWDALESAVANGAQPGADYSYQNSNYALLRVIIPALWQASPTNPGILTVAETNHALLYMGYVQLHVLAPAGVDYAFCYQTDGPDQTLYYDAFNPASPGVELASASTLDSCGAKNWNLSAIELARFMVYLRHTEALLSDESRALMDEGRLGWNRSSDDDTVRRGGKFWHGGWYYWPLDGGRREMHSCIMKFPGDMEAVLLMNSNSLTGRNACGHLLDSWIAAAADIEEHGERVVGLALSTAGDSYYWTRRAQRLQKPGTPGDHQVTPGAQSADYFSTAPGQQPSDVVAVAISASDTTYAWYRDGRVSRGTTRELDAHAEYDYTTAPGQDPARVIGVAISAENRTYAWYRDGTRSEGSTDDLDAHEVGGYTLPPGKYAFDVVDMAIDKATGRVWTLFTDGSLAVGTPDDLDLHGYWPLSVYSAQLDLDFDRLVGPTDFFLFRACLGVDPAADPGCARADFDGDGAVAPADFFQHLRPAFGWAAGLPLEPEL